MTSAQTAELLTEVQELIRERERAGVAGLAERVGPAEWADLVPQLEPAEVAVLLQWLPDDEIPTLLEELPPFEAARILRTLAAPEAAPSAGGHRPGRCRGHRRAAAAAGRGRDPGPHAAVGGRRDPRAERLCRRLGRRDHDAGFVAVTRDATATEAIAAIRRLVDQAETVNYVYVVDDQRRLLGVLSLYRLILSQAGTRVSELMAPTTVRVRANADQEVAARLLTDRNLLAIPVVDEDDRLLGIITEDDVADVLQAEATEDIERLGGSQPLNQPYRLSTVGLLVRKRVVWLLVLFVAEAYTGMVLRGFGNELSAVVALGFFIPMLIGTGGNIGSQTVTLIVRAMAIGEVTLRDVGWIVFRELRVGLIMGAVMGVVGFGQSLLLGVGTNIGLVVALTVLAISAWSATVAAALPLILRRLGVDPAVVSAPFISTLVDGTGLIIYFEIARFVLTAYQEPIGCQTVFISRNSPINSGDCAPRSSSQSNASSRRGGRTRRFTFSTAGSSTAARMRRGDAPGVQRVDVHVRRQPAAPARARRPVIRLITPPGTSDVASTSASVTAGSGRVSEPAPRGVAATTTPGASRATRPSSDDASGATMPTTPVGSGIVKLK